MIQTIGFNAFCDAFDNAGRGVQFSYEGKRVLFDYLEQLEEDTGEPYELDVIALCCDFSEEEYLDIIASYDIDVEGVENQKAELIECVESYLNDNTALAGESSYGIFVYQQF